MKQYRFVIGVTALNLLILLFTAAQMRPQLATQQVLRGHALELIDDRGQVRSRLDVDETGEVVLRLIDQNGTIRVKLGAADHGSGLLLLDDTTEPAVHIVARRTATAARPNTTGITLRGTNPQPRVIRP